MSTLTTPLAEQLKIILVGIRNAGKSSLMNNLFEKEIAIISDTPGTTTDPVTRSIELGDLGPIAVTDTAGIDDEGELGNLRIQKSNERLSVADIILFITPIDKAPIEVEKKLLEQIKVANKPFLFALTYGDKKANYAKQEWIKEFTHCFVDNKNNLGFTELKKKLLSLKSKVAHEISPLEGLVRESDFVLLVTPIDLAAPKGRLILPQVETIRDALDKDCATLVVKERELYEYYNKLGVKPKLVITDSQVFHKVAADIPHDQMLTSFSILFARKKGELTEFLEGIKALKSTPPNARILVMESCSHHRQADDIGTVKIPRLFKQLVRSDVTFEFSREFPDDKSLKEYFMIIHCAGCMTTKNAIVNRIKKAKKYGVYITNYGLFLSWVNGLLPRVLEPFNDIYAFYKDIF